jgi:hypothetical protein
MIHPASTALNGIEESEHHHLRHSSHMSMGVDAMAAWASRSENNIEAAVIERHAQLRPVTCAVDVLAARLGTFNVL